MSAPAEPCHSGPPATQPVDKQRRRSPARAQRGAHRLAQCQRRVPWLSVGITGARSPCFLTLLRSQLAFAAVARHRLRHQSHSAYRRPTRPGLLIIAVLQACRRQPAAHRLLPGGVPSGSLPDRRHVQAKRAGTPDPPNTCSQSRPGRSEPAGRASSQRGERGNMRVTRQRHASDASGQIASGGSERSRKKPSGRSGSEPLLSESEPGGTRCRRLSSHGCERHRPRSLPTGTSEQPVGTAEQFGPACAAAEHSNAVLAERTPKRSEPAGTPPPPKPTEPRYSPNARLLTRWGEA